MPPAETQLAPAAFDVLETRGGKGSPAGTPLGERFAPHAWPMFRSTRPITTMQRFGEMGMPYLFIRGDGPFAKPLSGRLNPRQMPPMHAEVSALGKDNEAQLRAAARAFAALHAALALHGLRGELVMHHRLAHLDRFTVLNSFADLAWDARACAVVQCLLRLTPQQSWYPTDSELLCSTVAAACLTAGRLVRRDLTAAQRLVARIPLEQRGRALSLAQTYVERHDLWQLREYLLPEARLLGDTELPSAWRQPWRWPGIAKDMAFWLMDMSDSEAED